MGTTTTNPILYETHSHTPLCNHATGQPEAYAAAAEARGLKGIFITCHNPTTNGWAPAVRMKVEEFEDYVAMVDQARQSWAGRVDVRLGLESDYVPGMESWLAELHSRAEFHYILGSVHAPLPDYKERYYEGEPLAFQRSYFEHLAMAAESGLFDCLAHPDLVKIVHPSAWQPEQLLDDIRRALDRIAATGIAMELNTSGLNKPLAEMHPGRPVLAEMKQRHIPVVMGADAHKPARVGADFEAGLDLLAEMGYEEVNLFFNRSRQPIDLAAARQSLLSPQTN